MNRKFGPTQHGQGSFFDEYINGKKYYSYKWTDSTGKRLRKRFPHSAEGEKERELFAKEIIAKMTAGIQTTCTETFGEWLLTYIKNYRKTNVDSDTYNRFLQYCANVPDTVANTMLDKLGPEQLQAMITGMQTDSSFRRDGKKKPLSYSTVKKIYELLFAALDKARVLKKIQSNPMEAVEKPTATIQIEKQIFSQEELKQFLKALKTLSRGKYSKRMRKDYLNLFFFLYAFGFRIGELLALTWDDIDLERQVIKIHKSKKSNRAGQLFGDTKTIKGTRTVPILSDAAYNRLAQMQKKSGNKGFLFPTASGKALGYFQVQRTFQKVCELAGIKKTLHEFRHTFGTNMAKAIGNDGKTIPIAELSRIMGHSKISTTQNFYVHSDETSNAALLDSFANKARRKHTKPVGLHTMSSR